MDALHLKIRNDIRELERIDLALSSFLSGNRVAGSRAYSVRLVTEELVRNVQRHSYGVERRDDEILLTLQLDRGNLWVHVEDTGPPFDPTVAPDPDLDLPLEERREGGLGLYLVRQVSEEVRYRRSGGCNRVSVRIALG
jgi:anti-sigma regulatory factor (Ser/Thr protein kinase)